MASRPVPQPSEASLPYWEACRSHELRIQRCLECGSLIHYPKLRCPTDGSDQFEWALMSGLGAVYSFVIPRRAFHPAFKDEVPYVIAIIELDEGVRVLSNLIGVEPDAVSTGMRVTVEWDDDAGEYPLAKFRPIAGEPA